MNLKSVANSKLASTKLNLNKSLKIQQDKPDEKSLAANSKYSNRSQIQNFNSLCSSPRLKLRHTLGAINEKSTRNTEEKKFK